MYAAPALPEWLPPRATSQASSYHTVLDHLPTTTNASACASVDSLPSTLEHDGDAASSTPPTSPELEYETVQHTRHAKALVIAQPTLVNFVPTHEIQTAVSVTADRVVIDTIFPPTAVLRAHHDVSPRAHLQEGSAKEVDTTELLKRYEAELRQTLREKLTPNYDPTGSIREEIYTTLTQVTRFPDPAGTDVRRYSRDRCPCVCCDAGCSFPVEAHSLSTTTTQVGSGSSSGTHSTVDMAESVPPSGSMRSLQDKGKKHRFGFLSLRSFGRSRSSVDLTRNAPADETVIRSKSTALPVPAPALPAEVTRTVPPVRSKSFSNLVRRRRSKHLAPQPHPELPTRHSARHSLDTPRTPRTATPLAAPTPPPRRSSKTYAVVPRKAVPSLASAATLPRGSLAFEIGRIVEEDELGDGVERRELAMMSSFGRESQVGLAL
ncbi:conserved hypothetical protein [Sporisorium reilianum SRZ2]|uniref:Uncharacterized protein n=1 Tax=Sporisorium reilianum (strain SRZ2) TaxID=999809 RepID=E6ZUY0_SPORE|nr:conserved hypothetical protein [Sporisorium reilianum SRZ2]